MGAPSLKFSQHQILVTEQMEPADVIQHAMNQGVYHLIQKDGVSFQKEKGLAELMISNPSSFFADPVRSIAQEQLVKENLFTFRCPSTTNKRNVIQYLEDFMHQHPKTKSVHDEVLLAADEIFTNASKNSGSFYDSSAGQNAIAGEIEFCAYIDQERVLIICSDSYGRLVIPQLLDKIRFCFERGVAGAIQQGDCGAGIGSFLIFNNCSSYYIGVEAGKRTVVGVGFQHTPRSSDKAALSKHLNFVSIE